MYVYVYETLYNESCKQTKFQAYILYMIPYTMTLVNKQNIG